MAILTITYEDGSFANWGLTEREADVSHFAIERLFGKPRLVRGNIVEEVKKEMDAKEEDRERTTLSST